MSRFIDISLNTYTFLDELNKKIQNNKNNVEELLKIKEKTFLNFVRPLELINERLEQFFVPLSHLNSVCNTKETQDVYAKALPIITLYSTELSQNLYIYEAYKKIAAKEQKSLNQEQKRVLELNILSYELSGAHLEETTKARLQEINIRKSELANDFSQNLIDATNEYEYVITDERDVEGIPPSDLQGARFEENGSRKYRFTLQMPSYIAYMTYGKNDKIREELYRAYTTRAPQNAKIIDELLALREEMSKLLGFENYASYSLASKMAKDEKSVLSFLQKLIDKSHPQAQNELKELEHIAQKRLQSYDSAFYGEILKKQKYDIDQEEYRPYFEQKQVLNGMFDFLEKVFGISFEKRDEKLWDEKTICYDLHVDNKLKARLYLDLEARKSKQSGAWMNNFQSRCALENGTIQNAAAVIVCNFAPSSNEYPSLLRHDDVVTLFHEMGHALHHMLSETDESGVSGVNGVEWDAVEFPSQFLENFAYEKEVLRLFGKHYKTQEVISDAMIDKLIESKNFLSALGMLRQMEFSVFDFKLHTKLYQRNEVQNLLDSIREETALIKPPSYNKFQNGFSHIFAGGYAAGYYSYKWAEVLSADAFYKVVEEGIFGSETAKKYLHVILQSGGSRSMDELFYELIGRDPNPDYLLRLNGIL